MPRILLLAACAAALAACDSSSEMDTLNVQPLAVSTAGSAFAYVDLSADLQTGNGVLAVPDSLTVQADSAARSIAWDLGFRGTEIVLNSGPSGPGAAVATFVDVPFDSVQTVDVIGLSFRRDGESVCEGGEARALCSEPGSPFSPYVLEADGTIGVDSDRTLVFRTGDAQGYGKVQFLSYEPADPGAPAAGGTVTLRYLVNPYGRRLVQGEEVSPL